MRCESGLRGVKMGYECIVDCDSLSLQFPAISFQNERFLYLIQTGLRCRYAVDSRLDLDSRRSSRILAHNALWQRLRTSQAMSIVRRKRQCAACLLHSHIIESRTIRQNTQAPNTMFLHYDSLLLCNDSLPYEAEALDPGWILFT